MQRPLIRDPRITDRATYVPMVGPLLAHGDGPEHVRQQMVATAAQFRRLRAEYEASDGPGSFGVGLCQGKAEQAEVAAAALVLYSDFPIYGDE